MRGLFLTRHGKNKLAIGPNGGPAWYYIRGEFGSMDDDDIELFALMVWMFNERVPTDQQIEQHLQKYPRIAGMLGLAGEQP